MSEWIVYSKDGLTERCRLKRLEYNGSFMNERTISATFEYHSEVAFDVFDYIVYRNEKFELESIPSVKKISNHNYEYELRFVSLKYELERCEMRDIVPKDNGVTYPTPLTFSFTGDVRYLTERIQANLDSLYGEGVWSIVIPEGVKSEEKNITISQQNCWNALSLVNTTYNLTFSIKGRVITVGGEQSLVGHVFQYGKGKGLYEIERVSDTDTGIVTKVRAYGGTRNLDYSYPKRPEWTDSVLPVSFALSPLRLMLPSFKLDGKTDYVLADDSIISEYGIREASVVYDDIYPSITGMLNYDDEPIDEIKSVDEVDDSKDTFIVYLYDLGFDLESNLTTENAQISMKSGSLIGYTFNISEIEKQEDNSYKITLGRITNEEGDTGNFNIPNSQWSIAAGDKFVLLNILMPQEYIRHAEERLLERAKEYLNEYGRTNFSYNVGLHDKFLKENANIYEELIEGSKLRIYDQNLGISEDVTIQSITITENMGDNMLTQVKVTLNNKPSASTIERIQGQIKELSETSAGQFSTQSELLKQYRRKLDKPFFDRLFAAVDINGNEIPSTDMTTPIAYIKARFNFATLGGVTMYLDDKSFNLPSIYDGLPIDHDTIYWENGRLKSKGGGSVDEGAVKEIIESYGYTTEDWVRDYVLENASGGIESITKQMVIEALGFTPYSAENPNGYITAASIPSALKNPYALTFGSKTYDGSVEQTILASDLGALTSHQTIYTLTFQSGTFASGSFTANSGNKTINIPTTTSHISEGDNLYFTNARAVSALADTLKSYVTLSGTQTISGEKNFTGGLKVNGSPIVYDASKKYWKLEGDLLITGGLTMYGSDSSFTPSTIMDAIAVDGTTISKEGGVLRVIGGGSGSISEITKQMVIDALGFTPYSAENPNGYITSATLDNYLPITSDHYLQNNIVNYGTTISSPNDISKYLAQGISRIHIGNVEYSSVLTGYDFIGNFWQMRLRPTYNDSLYIRTTAQQQWRKVAFVDGDITGSSAKLSVKDGTFGGGEVGLVYKSFQDVSKVGAAGINGDWSIPEGVADSTSGCAQILRLSYGINNFYNDLYFGPNTMNGIWWRQVTDNVNKPWHKVMMVNKDLIYAEKLKVHNYSNSVAEFVSTGSTEASIALIGSDGLRWTFGKGSYGTGNTFCIWPEGADSNTLMCHPTNRVSIAKMYADEALDVEGNGKFSGSVMASSLISNTLQVKDTINASKLALYPTDGWSDGQNIRPWYGYHFVYGRTDSYSTTISNYYGMTLKTGNCSISMNTSFIGINNPNPANTLHIKALTNSPIYIEQNYSSAWTAVMEAYNESLVAGQHYNINIGHSNIAYNKAWVGYYHDGVGSTNNRLSMGLHSVDDVFNITALGNVGIGTTSPIAKLHVVSSNSNGFIVQDSGRAEASIVYQGSDAKSWIVGKGVGNTGDSFSVMNNSGKIPFLINSEGNVGIGTTSPSAKLHIYGDVKAENGNFIGNLTGTAANAEKFAGVDFATFVSIIPTNTNQLENGAGFITSSGYSAGVTDYYDRTSNISIGYQSSSLTASQIDYIAAYSTASGNIVIKDVDKSTMQSWLGLGSFAYKSSLAFSELTSKPTTISGYGITDAITTSNIGSQSVNYATSSGSCTGNAASATKLSGNTSFTIWGQEFFVNGKPKSVNGAFRLLREITGTVVIHKALVYPTSPYGLITRAYIDGDISLQVQLEDNDSECFNLALNPLGGNVGIGTTIPSAKLDVAGNILATGGITMYSQRSLKDVVDERGLSLSELSAIKPTRYTWKDKRDNRIHFGGIADDIQQVLPEVVYNANGVLTMDYGNAGFAIASSLIKPVVDHEQRIKALEKENEELKQEIKRLRA